MSPDKQVSRQPTKCLHSTDGVPLEQVRQSDVTMMAYRLNRYVKVTIAKMAYRLNKYDKVTVTMVTLIYNHTIRDKQFK